MTCSCASSYFPLSLRTLTCPCNLRAAGISMCHYLVCFLAAFLLAGVAYTLAERMFWCQNCQEHLLSLPRQIELMDKGCSNLPGSMYSLVAAIWLRHRGALFHSSTHTLSSVLPLLACCPLSWPSDSIDTLVVTRALSSAMLAPSVVAMHGALSGFELGAKALNVSCMAHCQG